MPSDTEPCLSPPTSELIDRGNAARTEAEAQTDALYALLAQAEETRWRWAYGSRRCPPNRPAPPTPCRPPHAFRPAKADGQHRARPAGKRGALALWGTTIGPGSLGATKPSRHGAHQRPRPAGRGRAAPPSPLAVHHRRAT